jgi:hypothetical protein
MKRKLKIEDLAVASFSTGEDGRAGTRGTVRAAAASDGETQCGITLLVPESCIYLCATGRGDTCHDTCGVTCESCAFSCVRGTC